MGYENWCLINVWYVAFCQIYCKFTFLIRCFDFIVVISDMKFWEHLFLHKNANECFFFCQETCVYAKITVSTRFENWFANSPWLIKRIADFIILVMWLWIAIPATNLENYFTNQVNLFINENYSWKFQLQVTKM